MSDCRYCHEGMCSARDTLINPFGDDFECRFETAEGICIATENDLISSCCECLDEPEYKEGYCKRCYSKYFI